MRTFWLTPLLLLAVRTAEACGGFMCSNSQPVLQAAEQILFAVDGDKVTTIVQVQYQGPPGAFSWVLPLPGVPSVGVSTDAVFTQLRAGTDPKLYLDRDYTPGCNFNECPSADWTDGTDAFDGFSDGSDGSDGTDGGEEPPVEILGKGAVGPYDYTILTSESGASLYEWLNENGYDQPTTATPVIEHYAALGYPLVAVKLQSTSDVGDIVPIVLEYTSPTFACVPLRLTSIASAPNLPVRVWILGKARAVPLNYFHATVNAKQLPWWQCRTPSQSIWCEVAYENAAAAAVDAAGGRAFVTDAAGPTPDMVEPLAPIPLDPFHLEFIGKTVGDAFFFTIVRSAVGSTSEALRLWQQVLPMNPEVDVGLCGDASAFYGHAFSTCAPLHFGEEWVLDYFALASAFAEAANAPRVAFNALLEAHPYVTRLYTQISPNEMTLDPLFSFNPDLGRVEPLKQVHFRPVCAPDKDTTSLAELRWPDGTVEHIGTSCGGDIFPSVSGQPAWASIQVMNETGPATQLGTDEIPTHAPVVSLRAPSLGQSLIPALLPALQLVDTVSGGMSASATPLANAVDPQEWFAAHDEEAVDGGVTPSVDGDDGGDDADGRSDGNDGALDGTDLPADGDGDADGDADNGHDASESERPRPDSSTPTRDGPSSDDTGGSVTADTASSGCSKVGSRPRASWGWLTGLIIVAVARRRPLCARQ